MDYLKHYNRLMCSRKFANRSKSSAVYFEKHHIVPKSIGGDNEEKNLVLLTPKEHYFAHLLLYKHFTTIGGKKFRKIAFALVSMAAANNNPKKYVIPAKSYGIIKEAARLSSLGRCNTPSHNYNIAICPYCNFKGQMIAMKRWHFDRCTTNTKYDDSDLPTRKRNPVSKNITCCQKTMSAETRKKISESKKGIPRSAETKAKISRTRKMILNGSLSEEIKKKISDTKKGKPCSEEHRRKVSEAKKGKKITEEHKRKISTGLRKYYNIDKIKDRNAKLA